MDQWNKFLLLNIANAFNPYRLIDSLEKNVDLIVKISIWWNFSNKNSLVCNYEKDRYFISRLIRMFELKIMSLFQVLLNEPNFYTFLLVIEALCH